MLTLAQFDYDLPPEVIAQSPADPRDSSKLLVLNKNSGDISHHIFRDLVDLLTPNDVLIRNNTKVFPARIFGKKTTGGLVEILLLKQVHINSQGDTWEVMTKPGLKPGQKVLFEGGKLEGVCTEVTPMTRYMQFNVSASIFWHSVLEVGHTPIPPYIEWNTDDEEKLREIYQTTYAKISGSVAAPTAGLHFTQELDDKLQAKGVEILEVTLHVGMGTFLTVKTDNIQDHQMHAEWFEVSKETAEQLNAFKKQGKRLIAVGTTTLRTLESVVNESGEFSSQFGETKIFIYPPHKFHSVDGLITNFHLPKSTLLMLISAFVSSPNTDNEFTDFEKSSVGKAYEVAKKSGYKFFSFGDGMLIL